MPSASRDGEDLFGAVAEVTCMRATTLCSPFPITCMVQARNCVDEIAHECSADIDPSHRAGDPAVTQRGINRIKVVRDDCRCL